jgi:hypothetical protein
MRISVELRGLDKNWWGWNLDLLKIKGLDCKTGIFLGILI